MSPPRNTPSPMSRIRSPDFSERFDPLSVDSESEFEDTRRKALLESTRVPRSPKPSKSKQRQTIELPEFDPNTMDPASRCMIVGRPKTGKSTLASDLCSYQCNTIPVWEVFNGSEASNKHWKKRGIPDTFIHPELDLEAVKKFYSRQRLAIQQGIQKAHGAVIFDDCMHDDTLFKARIFKRLIKNGRNDKIFTIISTQEPGDPPKWIKSTIDYAFLFRETSDENLRTLHKYYGSMLGTLGDFREIMTDTAYDNRCIVINFQIQSNNIEDIVSWYKVDTSYPPEPLGSLDIWDWHLERYNEDYVDPID